MMTLVLKELFVEQARQDHAHRMKVLLTELDVARHYSIAPEFANLIHRSIERLQSLNVLGAYAQGCMLLSLFAGNVPIEDQPDGASPQLLVMRTMKKALDAGVSRGAFQHVFESLAGLGRFDQPWAEMQVPINTLTLLSALGSCPGSFQIDCDQSGPNDQNMPLVHNDYVNYFRTDSGFRHGVFGEFSPLALLNQVCQTTLPLDPWVISPHPLIERCELGREESGVFVPIQQMDLLDTRQIRLKREQHPLSLPATASTQLELSLQETGLFHDTILHIDSPLILVNLNFHAGWVNKPQAIVYELALDLGLQLLAGSLKWQGCLIHGDVLVNVTIQTQRDADLHWDLQDKKIAGHLLVGEPLWSVQKSIPLVVQIVSVIGTGKPLLSPLTLDAGHLNCTLTARVHPQSHLLELALTLGHSDLVCNWQSVDPLRGWSTGQWPLAKAATLMCWDLQRG